MTIRERKDKQGNLISFEIRVARGYTHDGNRRKPYVMTWRPPEGWSQRSVKAELNKVATQFERDCLAGLVLTKEEKKEQIELHQQQEAQKLTFSRYALEVFMPRKEATFSENSRDNYTRYLKQSFKYLGDKKMDEIQPIDLTNFFISLQTKETVMHMTKAGLNKTDQPLSYSTVIKYYTIMNSLFKMAYMDDVVQLNPMTKVERPKPRKNDAVSEIRAYTLEQSQHILDCVKNEPFQWRVIVMLFLDSGCRRGELAGLRWRSVNFEQNTISIENNLQYSPSKGVYATTPKGKKRRTLDIDPQVTLLMRQLKVTQTIQTIEGYCFTQEDGQPLHPQTYTRYFKSFGRKYGVSHLHPHKLRHTAASIAILLGADPASVSMKLGHEQNSTTMDMYVESNREAVKKANEIYRNALYQREG
jgi:integrase